jgi:uncharacterized protein YccT (UPF0319 family)
MKKTLKRSLLLILALLTLSMPFTVYAKTVDFTPNMIDYMDLNTGKKLAKKLGLKKKSNKNYALYYKGNNIIIGTNGSKINYPKKYTYVYNKGNKNFTFYGLKIGDTRSKIEKKLKKNHYTVTYTKGNVITYGPWYGGFELKFKNNKLVSWKYQLCPSG